MISSRKLVALFCLATLLLAALTPASSVLLFAIVVPLLLIVGLVAVMPLERQEEGRKAPIFFHLAAIPSRAPPVSIL